MTPNNVRKQLEAKFDCDLTERKAFIKQTALELLEEKTGGDEENQAEPAEQEVEAEPAKSRSASKKKEKTPAAKPKAEKRKRTEDVPEESKSPKRSKKVPAGEKAMKLSDALAAFVETDEMPARGVTQYVQAYIMENKLMDPSTGTHVLCDDKLRKLLGTDRMTLNAVFKALKKHLIDEKKSKKKKSADSEDKEKKNRGAAKTMILSDELAAVCKMKRAGRFGVVKALWVYIKEHNLQDPKDKRKIVCDDALFKIFKTKKVSMFSMNKHIGRHLYEPDPSDPAVDEVVEEEEEEGGEEVAAAMQQDGDDDEEDE